MPSLSLAVHRATDLIPERVWMTLLAGLVHSRRHEEKRLAGLFEGPPPSRAKTLRFAARFGELDSRVGQCIAFDS